VKDLIKLHLRSCRSASTKRKGREKIRKEKERRGKAMHHVALQSTIFYSRSPPCRAAGERRREKRKRGEEGMRATPKVRLLVDLVELVHPRLSDRERKEEEEGEEGERLTMRVYCCKRCVVSFSSSGGAGGGERKEVKKKGERGEEGGVRTLFLVFSFSFLSRRARQRSPGGEGEE